MGLRRNILASYISQGYVTLISIVMLPLYLQYLGAEAYGLVGFFTMLQAWFMMLDLGLSPTLSRETARYRGGALAAPDFRALTRFLELLFLAIALVGGAVLFLGAGFIAAHWLNTSRLAPHEIERSLQIIAVIIAMRWMAGLYRSVTAGSEQLVWLAVVGSVIATIRFVGVLLVLDQISATPTAFFSYQLMVAALELAILAHHARRQLPRDAAQRGLMATLATVKPLVKFSLALAFTSSVWVFVTQTDKLILSKLLPLAEYGYFSLAVLVAGGVMVVSGPVGGALMPRLARLEAEGNPSGLLAVYRSATQLVVVVATSTAATLFLVAEPLLYAWTGDRALAAQAAPTLGLYALGNGLLAVSAFPYYLQYAKGDLRLHMVGNVLFVVLLIPSIIWAASTHGTLGAGVVWLAMNAIYLLCWAPLVHRRFERTLNLPWFLRDILSIAVPTAIAGILVAWWIPGPADRWLVFGKAALVFGTMALLGAALTTTGWNRIRHAMARPALDRDLHKEEGSRA